MMRTIFLFILLTTCSHIVQAQLSKPNIIYILADDLGYGDLSCYNASSKIKTPVIDGMAQEGMMFTDAHSGSSVCSPTRYGILTGRYAWRTKLQSGVLWSYDEPLIPNERMTVAGYLKDNGYATACVGKWHLGLGWQIKPGQESAGPDQKINFNAPLTAGPTTIGFDYFYGISASLDIPPYLWIENNKITATSIDTIAEKTGKAFWRKGPIGNDFKHEDVLPQIADRSVTYIKEQAAASKPFFLYIPLTSPHTPILASSEYAGKSGINEYGDFVMMTDALMGRILEAVKQAGIDQNTMIIFTSDNGCSPSAGFAELAAKQHQPSGPFRGAKADIWEGGHRIPFIVKWPSKVAAGSSSSKTICLTDLFATTADLMGKILSADVGEDSYSILPLLLNQKGFARENTIHHSVEGKFAIRQGKWKLIFAAGSGGWSGPTEKQALEQKLEPLQLYDLDADPGETINLASKNKSIVSKLTQHMQRTIDHGRSTAGKAQQNDVTVKFR
jgi:arylsulfatase A-like enzyme